MYGQPRSASHFFFRISYLISSMRSTAKCTCMSVRFSFVFLKSSFHNLIFSMTERFQRFPFSSVSLICGNSLTALGVRLLPTKAVDKPILPTSPMQQNEHWERFEFGTTFQHKKSSHGRWVFFFALFGAWRAACSLLVRCCFGTLWQKHEV